MKLLMENIYVLEVPTDTSGGFGGGGKQTNVVLRLTDEQAAQLAFASDNGKIWFSLRAQSGASTPEFDPPIHQSRVRIARNCERRSPYSGGQTTS